MLESRKDLYSDNTNQEISGLNDARDTNREAFDEIDRERKAAIDTAASYSLSSLDILNDELRNKKHLRHHREYHR